LSTRLSIAFNQALAPPTDTLSQLVLLFQITALVTFAWAFWPLIAAIAHFTTYTAPGSLADLRPGNQPMHELYRSMVSLLVFSLVASSIWLFRLKHSNAERPGMATVAGAMPIAIGLFLFGVPFQVLFHNKAERAIYASEICYLAGQNGEGQVRLFCPTAAGPRRTQTVGAGDSRLMRTGIVESVFTELDYGQLAP
jgi:hypothetical protein